MLRLPPTEIQLDDRDLRWHRKNWERRMKTKWQRAEKQRHDPSTELDPSDPYAVTTALRQSPSPLRSQPREGPSPVARWRANTHLHAPVVLTAGLAALQSPDSLTARNVALQNANQALAELVRDAASSASEEDSEMEPDDEYEPYESSEHSESFHTASESDLSREERDGDTAGAHSPDHAIRCQPGPQYLSAYGGVHLDSTRESLASTSSFAAGDLGLYQDRHHTAYFQPPGLSRLRNTSSSAPHFASPLRHSQTASSSPERQARTAAAGYGHVRQTSHRSEAGQDPQIPQGRSGELDASDGREVLQGLWNHAYGTVLSQESIPDPQRSNETKSSSASTADVSTANPTDPATHHAPGRHVSSAQSFDTAPEHHGHPRSCLRLKTPTSQLQRESLQLPATTAPDSRSHVNTYLPEPATHSAPGHSPTRPVLAVVSGMASMAISPTDMPSSALDGPASWYNGQSRLQARQTSLSPYGTDAESSTADSPKSPSQDGSHSGQGQSLRSRSAHARDDGSGPDEDEVATTQSTPSSSVRHRLHPVNSRALRLSLDQIIRREGSSLLLNDLPWEGRESTSPSEDSGAHSSHGPAGSHQHSPTARPSVADYQWSPPRPSVADYKWSPRDRQRRSPPSEGGSETSWRREEAALPAGPRRELRRNGSVVSGFASNESRAWTIHRWVPAEEASPDEARQLSWELDPSGHLPPAPETPRVDRGLFQPDSPSQPPHPRSAPSASPTSPAASLSLASGSSPDGQLPPLQVPRARRAAPVGGPHAPPPASSRMSPVSLSSSAAAAPRTYPVYRDAQPPSSQPQTPEGLPRNGIPAAVTHSAPAQRARRWVDDGGRRIYFTPPSAFMGEVRPTERPTETVELVREDGSRLLYTRRVEEAPGTGQENAERGRRETREGG